MGLLFDTGHLTFAGDDPAAVAKKWAKRINHVHMKDVRPDVLKRVRAERLELPRCGARTASTRCPATAASTSWPPCSRWPTPAMRGWLICEAEQDPAKAHPLTYARKGYATIKVDTAEKVGLKLA